MEFNMLRQEAKKVGSDERSMSENPLERQSMISRNIKTIDHGNVGVLIPGMLAELGMLTSLPPISLREEGFDSGSLVRVKLLALRTFGISLGISLGRSAGTFFETVCSDISCLPPFLRETAREGESAPPKVPATSMETESSGRKIRSRLLNVDEAPLAGSRVVIRSCSVPGLRFPSVLMRKSFSAGFMEILILPAGSRFRPVRVIL
jgi:hypothetical protein